MPEERASKLRVTPESLCVHEAGEALVCLKG